MEFGEQYSKLEDFPTGRFFEKSGLALGAFGSSDSVVFSSDSQFYEYGISSSSLSGSALKFSVLPVLFKNSQFLSSLMTRVLQFS